jgi:hypothetical protein
LDYRPRSRKLLLSLIPEFLISRLCLSEIPHLWAVLPILDQLP